MMDYNKFAPRVDGTKTEKTGNRNTKYSVWHRALGPEYFAVDVDFVEWRDKRGIVAFLAVTGECVDESHIKNSKKYIWARTKLEREVLHQLSIKCDVPAYFVIHDNDLTIFHVHDLNQDLETFQRMNISEYAEFIKKL